MIGCGKERIWCKEQENVGRKRSECIIWKWSGNRRQKDYIYLNCSAFRTVGELYCFICVALIFDRLRHQWKGFLWYATVFNQDYCLSIQEPLSRKVEQRWFIRGLYAQNNPKRVDGVPKHSEEWKVFRDQTCRLLMCYGQEGHCIPDLAVDGMSLNQELICFSDGNSSPLLDIMSQLNRTQCKSTIYSFWHLIPGDNIDYSLFGSQSSQ